MQILDLVRQSLRDKNAEQQLRSYFIGLQGVLAFLFITPFAAMRFFNDELFKAAIDIILVLGMGSLSTYTLLFANKRHINFIVYVFASFYILGSIAVVYFSDIYTVMWTYAAAISSYFILSSKQAILASLAILISCLIIGFSRFTAEEVFLVSTTFVLTCILSFILSVQITHDRRVIENHSFYDALTGAKNRTLLIRELQNAIEEQVRSKKNLSLITFDIDHFKTINDTKGHDIGDQVLKEIVYTANSLLKPEQNIYRLGGEEFFILTHCNDNQSKLLAESIRDLVEKTPNSSDLTVTLSLGVAIYKQGESLQSWTERADKALYASKENGRNQVTVAA